MRSNSANQEAPRADGPAPGDSTEQPDRQRPDSDESRLTRLRGIAARFRAPAVGDSVWQVANSFVPLIALWAAMYLSLGVSYWLTAALAIPAAGLVLRIFIIQHDCGHGSFLRSRNGNKFVGRLCSLVTFTPFANWQRHHTMHHANWNNLDQRHSGMDIYSACLTVAEYQALSPWGRMRHRLLQQPLIALIIFPPLIFLALYRVPFDTPPSWHRERRSVWLTNAALIVLYAGLGWILGFREVLLIQVPIVGFAAIFGVWLFSLQHRFKRAVWMRGGIWDASVASLSGSSFLKLPRLLQWFTGNIGYHHIHHLDTRVPNYRLEECHNSDARLHSTPAMSLFEGLRSWRYALWDEVAGRMVRIVDLAQPKAEGAR